MLQIRLENITEPDKSSVYIIRKRPMVCLGNGVKRSFKGFTQAEKFLIQVNRELNEIYFNLVEIQRVLSDSYWSNFLYFDCKPNNSKIFNKELDVYQNLTDNQNYLKSSATRSSLANGNYTTFSSLKRVIDNQLSICRFLIKLREKKKHTIETLQLRRIEGLILEVEQRLSLVGK